MKERVVSTEWVSRVSTALTHKRLHDASHEEMRRIIATLHGTREALVMTCAGCGFAVSNATGRRGH